MVNLVLTRGLKTVSGGFEAKNAGHLGAMNQKYGKNGQENSKYSLQEVCYSFLQKFITQ